MLVEMHTATTHPDADVSKLPIVNSLNGSLADRVYLAVKQAILQLDFPPGAFIRKAALCDQLGVSRSPVSEALARLATEGLVDIVPQSGTRVARLSMAAIRDDAFLREALEVAAARHAALHRTDEMLARLTRNIEMQKLQVVDVDAKDFFETDIALHEMLMATTGVARLPETVRMLSSQVDRARQMLLPHSGRLSETVAEHIDLIDAVARRDAKGAEDAMRHHVRQLIKRLEPLEADRPDLFSK
ncbi:MAG: GntR family transcriptional regulator [Pseudomonadota bacterium]